MEYDLNEEEVLELQISQWAKFYSCCVQYQQVGTEGVLLRGQISCVSGARCDAHALLFSCSFSPISVAVKLCLVEIIRFNITRRCLSPQSFNTMAMFIIQMYTNTVVITQYHHNHTQPNPPSSFITASPTFPLSHMLVLTVYKQVLSFLNYHNHAPT